MTAEEKVRVLRKAVDAALTALRLPENGVHYCRSCDAGTANKWQHADGCRIAEQTNLVNAARETGRAALLATAPEPVLLGTYKRREWFGRSGEIEGHDGTIAHVATTDDCNDWRPLPGRGGGR